MALYTSTGPGILSPEEVNELVVRPVSRMSVAYQVSQLIVIGSHEYRFPILREDPAASWVAEGAEIPVDDPDITELTVTPKKVAGLTVVSREMANDSINPGAQDIVGEALARDVARQVDVAYFGPATPTNGPSGLGTLTGIAEVNAGSITNTDPFAEGQSMAEDVGAAVSFWVASPSTVLHLSTLKQEATNSNLPLLQPDPTQPTRRQILGVPLISSPAVDDVTIWGVPHAFSYVVQNDQPTLDVDASPFFTSDRVAVRTTLRVAFGHPHPAAVVKISHGGS